MKILVTGSGKSGSWQIRGEQLGRAIGADVIPRAEAVQGYDLAILVKRPPADLIERLHRRRVPIVWDVVDAWPQPDGNDWPEARCKAWLAERVGIIRPAAIVAATEAMAADCRAFGIPVLALPHHARPDQPVNPIRDVVRTVVYEGGENYVRDWRPKIEAACLKRGWRFVVNPPALADGDIVLALRDQGGYAPRAWKSNVKLANAQGTGTPCVLNREAGYLETASSAECWADNAAELDDAFDLLADRDLRRKIGAELHAAAPRLEDIATTYRAWLAQLSSS